ncbi:septal ring lytic transglycosylase RlpA family protein [Pseudomonas sp. AOB-7]|jgi:rare lipoprotein A|uniref:septal ring lytic transglycosylase RlpA family protein n=1 Tax=Pseudomonas sp. AOB-7 TaxID=2482750 RepID=UPI000EFA9974|nr:septal ring lytic transglycosylase RlpA family protein [Pseudomonas sp. AOB-7]RMH84015.1 septal ring lytic transglycosylase RlpA family protein [Pseudomonas sp. AOB-7]
MLICNPDAIRESLRPRIASGLQAVVVLGLLAVLAGCSTFGSSSGSGATETGKASYYGDRHHGRKTASGERFDQHALTAAHRSLPFGTRVRVTNLSNERSVVVRINDRGPFVRGRIIDVSRAAAERLGMLRAGVVPVRVEQLK